MQGVETSGHTPPLRWPDHLKNASSLARLLFGIPLLGRDMRAYRRFREQVRQRPATCCLEWDADPAVCKVRDQICHVLVEDMDWPLPNFVPDDPCAILFFDPTIDIKAGTAMDKVRKICGCDDGVILGMTIGKLVELAAGRSNI